MDGLTAAFFVAFVVGAGFGVVSFLVGSLHGHSADVAGHATATTHGGGEALGAGHDMASGHALPAHGAPSSHALPAHGADSGPSTLMQGLARTVGSFCNITALATLCCVGGGVGFLLRRMGAGVLLSLLTAIPSGLSACYLVGRLLRWLRLGTRYLEPGSLDGMLANVLAPVGGRHTGEVMYVKDGRRRALPARSTNDRLLAPGAEVVILEVRNGIARVAPADELWGEAPVGADAAKLARPQTAPAASAMQPDQGGENR
jgi:hypothetical protein